MALQGQSVGMVSVAGSAAEAAQLYAWSEPLRRAPPTHPRSPSDLLMVHAVCGSHTVSVTDSRHADCRLWLWHDPRISQPPQLKPQN